MEKKDVINSLKIAFSILAILGAMANAKASNASSILGTAQVQSSTQHNGGEM